MGISTIKDSSTIKQMMCFYENIDDLKPNKDCVDNKELYSITFIYCAYSKQIFTLSEHGLTVQSLFLTIITIFTSVISYILSNKIDVWIHWPIYEKISLMLLPFLFIIFVCYVWFCLLKEYDNLNDAFTTLTAKMEDRLPIKPLSALIKATKHFNINHNIGMLTRGLPILFALLYTILFLYIALYR